MHARPVEISRGTGHRVEPGLLPHAKPKTEALAEFRDRRRLLELRARGAAERDAGRKMVARHELDRLARDDAHALQRAAVEEHLREPPVVRGRRHHAAAAGKEFRPRGERARHRRPLSGLRVGLGLGDAVGFFGRHHEPGVAHVERPGDARGDEPVEVHARDDFDDAPEHVGRHAVVPDFARLVLQRQLRELGDELGVGLVRVEHVRRAVGLLDERVPELAVGDPGGMPEQVLHGHFAPHGFQHQRAVAGRVGFFHADLQVFQFGQDRRHRIDEPDLAFLGQHHDRKRDHGLGHRRDAENGIDGHRQFFLAVAIAEGLQVFELAAAGDQGHGARNDARVDVGPESGCEAREALPGQAHGFGFRHANSSR